MCKEEGFKNKQSYYDREELEFEDNTDYGELWDEYYDELMDKKVEASLKGKIL
ncbi:MAG: hypothetical protein LBU10_01165 [Endomicrobium sp.]|jgi:hypothetical protein|nr:hypothetical protein [Endomicrobium sp.]